MFDEFRIPAPEDDSDRKLLSDIEQYGWHVPHIFADGDGPGYSFSVGFYLKFEHPEVLVMGLSQSIAHQIINLVGGLLMTGKRFSSGKRTDDIMKGFSCSFVPIAIENYQKYLGYDIWFYRSLKQPFPALQIVWPDKQGLFPWESGYDQRLFSLQTLLNGT